MSAAGGRGYCPTDERDFTGQGLRKLRAAATEVDWLLDRGYSLKSAVTFCANHHLLSERQRIALARWCASEEQLRRRQAREAAPDAVRGIPLDVDGFNIIITLETGLCGSLLLECRDGAIRDLAGLRGSYRLIPQTDDAIRLIADQVRLLRPSSVTVWLDRPVSNSGRLGARIRELWPEDLPPVEIAIVPDVDRQLMQCEFVATSDSVILDNVAAWYNLTKPALAQRGTHFTTLEQHISR